MTASPHPEPPREALLIAAKRTAMGLSARQAARRAGFSVALWSKIEKGYDQVARGVVIPFRGTAEKVARAAQVVGAVPADLLAAGRGDAAQVLSALPPLPAEPMTLEELHAEVRRLAALVEGRAPDSNGNGSAHDKDDESDAI